MFQNILSNREWCRSESATPRGGGGVNWSLTGQEFKMTDEILLSDWPISNRSLKLANQMAVFHLPS